MAKSPNLEHKPSSELILERTLKATPQDSWIDSVPSTTPRITLSETPLPTTENVGDVDGMGTVKNDQADMRVMGSSSAADFMKQIRELVDSRVGLPHQSLLDKSCGRTLSLSHPWMWNQRAQQKSETKNFVLPSRTIADSLIDTYWTEVHTLYSFFHRPSFDQEYRRVWLGEIPTNFPLHAKYWVRTWVSAEQQDKPEQKAMLTFTLNELYGCYRSICWALDLFT